MRVAAAQLRSTPDPGINAGLVAEWAARAADAGAQLVVFPEAMMANFTVKLAPLAQTLDGPFVTRAREVAAAHGVWVVAGMFEPADDGRVHNTVIATDGDRVHHYRKQHLYDSFGSQESKTVKAGTDLVTFEALGTRIGLATCYDVRFAEQFINLRRAGAEVVCLPTSWAPGPQKVDQWQLLVRARAMDAQAFVLGADQAGDPNPDDNPKSRAPLGVGYSLVAGPLGEVVAKLGANDDLMVADLDLDRVPAARAAIPMD
ncbi:nitrilase-related carbon-nitrogen hydrolase [Propionibacteriaceae bacterium G1746]|uniref:nitrilase-related carbon-nitrogen hydrolase n=1 Tax=Aestuariimicrobium sp. G57 TaxID=3418485 RepID=UPI003C1ECD95